MNNGTRWLRASSKSASFSAMFQAAVPMDQVDPADKMDRARTARPADLAADRMARKWISRDPTFSRSRLI